MKRVAAAALLLAVAALVVVGPMVAWQERMIYFPQQVPLADWTPPGLAPWPSADDARGLAASPEGPPRATAVVFHVIINPISYNVDMRVGRIGVDNNDVLSIIELHTFHPFFSYGVHLPHCKLILKGKRRVPHAPRKTGICLGPCDEVSDGCIFIKVSYASSFQNLTFTFFYFAK